MPIVIEHARPEDAMAMAAVHHAAIHATDRSFYAEEIIRNWAGGDPAVIAEQIAGAMADDDIVVLAARRASVVVGYGMVCLSQCYLGAIYITPLMMGQTIGAHILAGLEAAARRCGLAYLKLDASLNAERFYLKNGYRPLGRDTHSFGSGVSMACIKMKKTL